MRVANVFVNIPVKSIAKAYTYRVPDELSFVEAGWRVFVPFGGRRVEGFIVETGEQEASKVPLKDIISVVDDEAWFTPKMIAAAKWLSDFYLCSLAEMMRLFMPGKSGLKIFVRYEAVEEAKNHLLLGMEIYWRVYELLLQEGALTKAEIKKHLAGEDFSAGIEEILGKLISYNIIKEEYVAEKRMHEQYERYVVKNVAVTEKFLEENKRRKAQCRLLQLLEEKDAQRVAELKAQKISDAVLRSAEEAGFVSIKKRRIFRDSYRELKDEQEALALTEDQQKAMDEILPAVEAGECQKFLLHGVTGSGKTQVYIEVAERVRKKGRSVIVLVPEIALTGQLVKAFKAYFHKDIIVMHSQLSLSERNDAIFRMRRGDAGIVIGARSALFTPAENIGLIIMDEEQDASYKQDESPRYHARVVAEKLSELHGAVLLLGSATPSMESFHRAKLGELKLLTMPKRIGDMPLPVVHCVDMRQELRMGNRHVMSRELQQLMEDTIHQKQQMIVMLNRRGYSTFVMCRSCGEVLKCKLCGMPLVYHTNGKLSCHHCDVQEEVPSVCPKCGSRYIKYFGSGTEKLEKELQELVPSARVIRMDRDTTARKLAHQEILNKFRRGEYDILLGTQMVAKGHDIPNVTAVGIISADSSLNLPDFRAAERCFMLITQTAGRAGRGCVQGKVVVQSYSPEHYAVACGIRQDYQGFYEKEIEMRRELFYPPFSRLVKLIFRNESEEIARQNAAMLVDSFLKKMPLEKNQIIGPSPAMIARLRNVYRFVVLIKTEELSLVQDFLRKERMHLRADVAIDIDPISMM